MGGHVTSLFLNNKIYTNKKGVITMEEILTDFYQHYQDIQSRVIFTVLTGSRVRGLSTQESDFDIIVVVYDDWTSYGKTQQKVWEVDFKSHNIKVLTIHRYLKLLEFNHFNYIESLFNQNYLDTPTYISAYYSQELFFCQIDNEIGTYRTNKRATPIKVIQNIQRLYAAYNRLKDGDELSQQVFQRATDYYIDEELTYQLGNNKYTEAQITQQTQIRDEWLKRQIEFNYQQIKQ